MPPPALAPRKPRPGDELQVDLTSIDDRRPAGRLTGTADHATGTYSASSRAGIPGERALARVLRRRGTRLDVRRVAALRPSPDEVPARCPHFGSCGGCSYQDTAYARQLAEKTALAERILRAAGLLDGAVAPAVDACLACEDPWRYRNKMDFTFSARRWVDPSEPQGAERGFALGLHPAGRYTEVIDVARCEIAFEGAAAILASARRLARAQGLEPWDVRARAGLLRHLVLRRSRASGEILADLATSADGRARIDAFARELLAAHPEITTLVQHVHERAGQTACEGREIVLHGTGRIRERLLGLTFSLSAHSFFQPNTRQAERLVEIVRAEAAAAPGGIAWDLYCGVGTMGLALAGQAREVWGFELSSTAVADARENARANGVERATFVAGDLAARGAGGAPAPDLIVADPPRAGLHPAVVSALGTSPARRMVYVSCNLRAAARDLLALRPSGWALARVRPVDLFPHTPHVECVLSLERGGVAT